MKLLLGLLFFMSAFHAAIAAEEIAGGSDFPDVGRVAESVMLAYDIQEYGEGVFLEKGEEGIEKRYIEGSLSSYVYVLKSGQSPILAVKNYQQGFAELGDVTDVYSCRADECDRSLGSNFAWEENRRFKASTEDLTRALKYRWMYSNQRYWFGTVKSENVDYAVSIYTAQIADKPGFVDLQVNDTLVRVDIVANKSFEKNLEVIDASVIETKIAQTGFIDLYGLYFDTGSHVLKETSIPAMGEIVKFLQANPVTKLYVVGHTDSDGTFEYNQSLSERRAQEVVSRLVNDHGISPNRLQGVGVGLVSPIASNDSEDGKALNRRVVLVKNYQ